MLAFKKKKKKEKKKKKKKTDVKSFVWRAGGFWGGVNLSETEVNRNLRGWLAGVRDRGWQVLEGKVSRSVGRGFRERGGGLGGIVRKYSLGEIGRKLAKSPMFSPLPCLIFLPFAGVGTRGQNF